MTRRPSITALLFALGCEPELGVCDEEAAQAVVYDLDGQPAFEGQALVIQSCGSGGFCHSEGIEAAERFGAPRGLEFDLRLVSQTPDVNEDALARLSRAQANAYFMRRHVLAQIQSGAMPPDVTGVPIGRPEYQRVPDGAREGPAIPALSDEGSQDVLRNWLACGAPVVERTLMRNDGNENTVGETRPVIETTPVDPVWSAIYPRVIERSCAYTMCHDSTTAAGNLDMSTSAGALAALRSPAAGRLCMSSGAQRVVPGDPEASLIIHKLRGVGPDGRVCGSRMPSAGSYLSAGRIESIEMWIENGANDD